MPSITPPKKAKQSRVTATVTFTPEEFSAAESKALSQAAEGVKLPGFRPGKAPVEKVREKIDENALMEEIIRILLPPVFDALIKEHQLKPIIPPKVELESRSPMTLSVTVIEKPDVKVKGADKIKITKAEPKVDAKDIDRMIDYLKTQYRKTSPADRAAKESDELTIDFTGTMDGKPVEGTTANDYKIVIGSKSLIPGFEDALVGLKKGEQKTFTVTFPADYHAGHIKGKPVEFAVTVKQVEDVQMPAFTDAFVKEHHLGESVADLRSKVEGSMRMQEEQSDRTRREKELFDAIRTATTIDLAPELITNEERLIFEEIQRNLERDKMTMDDWLQKSNRTVEKLKKELTDEAAKRLTLRFAIQHLVDEKNVTVTPEEMSQAISAMLEDVPKHEKKSAEAYYKEGSDGYEEVQWRKRVEKLVEQMLKQ